MIRRGGDGVLITTHAKPDGDAFGSVLALTVALHKAGQRATACLMPPVPAYLMQLRGAELVRVHQDGDTLVEPGLVVVLDTGAWAQLAPIRPQLEGWTDRTLIIDHHLNGDVPARWHYIDAQGAACCEIVAQLLDEMKLPFDPIVCEALYVGIASDTGWFRFSNTRPQTHELAARLLRQGVDHAELYRKIEQAERPEKLALLIRALDSLQLLADGRVAVMTLRAADFAETGAVDEETERFVDVPQAVTSVQMVVLITESPSATDGSGRADRPIRLSFRSKPGPGAINVARLAQRFGGGGHARAAGAKVDAPLEDVILQITEVLTAAVVEAQT